MDMLNILLPALALFLLFITPSVVRRVYIRKRYLNMLDQYKKDYEEINTSKSNNVYSIEDYRNRKKERIEDDIFEYSDTHNMIWSEESQKYIKMPKNIPIEDE